MKITLYKHAIVLITLFISSLSAYPAEGKLDIKTRKTFFTIGQDSVELDVRLSIDSDVTGKKLMVRLRDTSGKLVKETDIEPIGFSNKIVFKDLVPAKYIADATLSTGSNIELQTSKWFRVITPTAKTSPQVKIKSGIMYVDDKPFFIISTGCSLTIAERKLSRDQQIKIMNERMAEIADHGFNLIYPSDSVFSEDFLTYPDIPDIYRKTAGWGKNLRLNAMKGDRINFDDYLKMAEKHGLYVMGWVKPITRSREMSNRQIEIWSDLILKYRNNNNILCWKTEDETDTWPEHNLKLYKLFKELDPTRPVRLVVINAVQENVNAADILSTDPYPIGNKQDIGSVAAHAERLKQLTAANKDQMFCLWLQMFGIKHERRICPTPRQLKAMAFLALNHGAKGLYYHIFKPKHLRDQNDWELTGELWHSMKSLNKQTNEMSLPYLRGKDFKGIRCKHKSIAIAAKAYQDHLYIIAVNMSMQPIVTARIFLPKKTWPNKVEQLFDKRFAKIRNNTIEAGFNSNAVRIYKIKLSQVK